MRNNTDRNDARGIARMMRLGWYRAVHVKNIDMQKLRSLLSNRKLLKPKLINKLASILHRMWVSETDFHVGFGAKVTRNDCV